ncbi:glycosyltransferase family protein [Halobacterium salinarum]|uniref:glycosyltransferase family protein n=1 Tax=Halobacterium salinarum TaxID=2242 RepID=UPI0025548C43|nr:glycosyltransferase family protein [Halobacterium salinarum]MDL0132504.1 glycosyltransferase family protein [Halobacterium salinarum]
MPNTVAIIQARTGSTRLPGKVMYPLDGQPALKHVVTRAAHADNVTDVVVATSTEPQDDVIAQYAPKFGAKVVRGSESDVLSRFKRAVEEYHPDTILRITGDCPLIDPTTIDSVISPVEAGKAEYASNIGRRTFPRGLDVEAFGSESFKQVLSKSETKAEREHVTPYYRKHPNEFDIKNVTSEAVFDDERYINRTDIRLTLDEADDYRLLKRIYDEIEYEDIISIRDVVDYVDAEDLSELNEAVRQKEI